MYSKTVARASARVRNLASWTHSVLSEAKKLSMGALSRQLPRRLIDGWMPCRSSTARYGPAAYCPGSSGRRNSCVRRSQQLVKGLGRCSGQSLEVGMDSGTGLPVLDGPGAMTGDLETSKV